MDALVMCGGEGNRFESSVEKPLHSIGGKPMIDRVVSAIESSSIETVWAAVSPTAPNTRSWVKTSGVRTIETDGNGYVTDLTQAQKTLDLPILTITADLPLVTGETIDSILETDPEQSLTVCVPVQIKRELGLSIGPSQEYQGREIEPTGINIVSSSTGNRIVVRAEQRVAVNVNTRSDARIAEELL